jgi:hypothetical protein
LILFYLNIASLPFSHNRLKNREREREIERKREAETKEAACFWVYFAKTFSAKVKKCTKYLNIQT